MLKKRILFFILTIFIMIIIFLFSCQSSKDSNTLSYSISDVVYQEMENIGNIAQENTNTESKPESSESKDYQQTTTFHDINIIIRKSAHVFLYMLLALFLILFIRTYNLSTKKAIIITILFCFTYACLDEFNQYMRGTRSGRFTDTLIDTGGCILGCVINEFIIKIKTDKLFRRN